MSPTSKGEAPSPSNIKGISSSFCVHQHGGMNTGVNVLEFKLGMAYILSERQLRLRVKPVILIALLNVCHGGDAGKHS